MMSLRKLPGVAEVAMQSGLYAGHRVRRELAGEATSRSFRYHDLGSAAYISRGHAVVSAGPVKLSGMTGWLTWLFVHIAFLTGYRNRVGAILTWSVAFSRDIRRERAFTTRPTGMLQDLYEPLGGPADKLEAGTGDSAAATPRPPAQRQARRNPSPTAVAPNLSPRCDCATGPGTVPRPADREGPS